MKHLRIPYLGRLQLVLVAVLSSLILGAQEPPTLLGVLEDTPGHYYGDPHYRSVRVVFSKEGNDWKAFPSDCRKQDCLKSVIAQYPPEVNWTIGFDGKRIGKVTSHAPDVGFQFYSGIGQESIMSTGPVPTVGNPSEEFAGFISSPVLRPLMANSRPYFRDPEHWMPGKLPYRTVDLLRKQFRKQFPDVTNCKNLDEQPEPWRYRDENVKLLKAYSSKNKWAVARVRLEENRCDGPADDPFMDQWFAVSPAGNPIFLGQGMWLVDAGDYDNDGKSELVFAIDRYNRGGYVLFYDEFKKHVTFEFSYH